MTDDRDLGPRRSVRPKVVVVGLGPAGPEFTTPAAYAALSQEGPRYLRTARHPAAAPWVERGAFSFDVHYEMSATFDQTYEAIVNDLVDAASAHGRVVYAVPGSPSILERTVVALRNDPRVSVEIVPGLSFLDLAWDRLVLDPIESAVRLVNGEQFAVDAATDYGPLLVSHTWSNEILSAIKLSCDPPDGTTAVILHHLGCDDELVTETDWADLDRTIDADHLTCVYIPSLGAPPAGQLARVAEVVRVLRAECPWDAEQTHQSLVRHLLEETYEAIEAIEELGDPPDIAASEHLEEELGDVLCQVLFHSTIAEEEGLFSLADVARSLADKLVRRHPHVFARDQEHSPGIDMGSDAMDGPSIDAESVLSRWEQQKQLEKGRSSLTDGIPRALPALAYAAKLEKKAATVGLGMRAAETPIRDRLEASIDGLIGGDGAAFGALLFDVASLAASVGVDPEEALRHAASAMRAHFVVAEQLAEADGVTLIDATPAARLRYWEASHKQ